MGGVEQEGSSANRALPAKFGESRLIRDFSQVTHLSQTRGHGQDNADFRTLGGVLGFREYTHGIYPYPARLLKQIPRHLLRSGFILDSDVVVDPFCGSGTVLAEAQLSGRSSIGFDSNPIAALIAAVKVTPIDADLAVATADRVLKRASSLRRLDLPADFLARWYEEPALRALSMLSRSVAQLESSPEADVSRLALALTSRKVSLVNPRIPVPVLDRTRGGLYESHKEIYGVFANLAQHLVEVLRKISPDAPSAKAIVGDSRSPEIVEHLRNDDRKVILTSPPYGAAQKYVRSTSLELGWLRMASSSGTAELERVSIGREHINKAEVLSVVQDDSAPDLNEGMRRVVEEAAKSNPRRAAIYALYLKDMKAVWTRVLTPANGVDVVCLVAGTNRVVGVDVPTHAFLAEMIESAGYQRRAVLRDEIRGRILQTTRAGGSIAATSEYIYVFEKAHK